MAANVNVVAITGNLTKDPEVRHTGSGTAVCQLRIATNGREKRNGEWVDRADYFDITVWGNQGENCANYLSKGKPVAVQGRLRYEEWEKDGNKRSKVVIVANHVQFLPSKDGGGGGGQSSESNADVPDGGNDDIPF